MGIQGLLPGGLPSALGIPGARAQTARPPGRGPLPTEGSEPQSRPPDHVRFPGNQPATVPPDGIPHPTDLSLPASPNTEDPVLRRPHFPEAARELGDLQAGKQRTSQLPSVYGCPEGLRQARAPSCPYWGSLSLVPGLPFLSLICFFLSLVLGESDPSFQEQAFCPEVVICPQPTPAPAGAVTPSGVATGPWGAGAGADPATLLGAPCPGPGLWPWGVHSSHQKASLPPSLRPAHRQGHTHTHSRAHTHTRPNAHTFTHSHVLTCTPTHIHTLTSSKNKQSSPGTVQIKSIFKRNFLKKTQSTKTQFYPQEDSRLPHYAEQFSSLLTRAFLPQTVFAFPSHKQKAHYGYFPKTKNFMSLKGESSPASRKSEELRGGGHHL